MLTRRLFIATGLALTAFPTSSLAQVEAYAPGLAESAMQEGARIVLMFGADWCSTCRRQERVIDDLRAFNPRYDAELRLIRVDWDDYGRGDLVRALAVPRRSTLIALHGQTEVARIVAGTGVSEIETLLDRALGS